MLSPNFVEYEVKMWKVLTYSTFSSTARRDSGIQRTVTGNKEIQKPLNAPKINWKKYIT